MCVFERKSPATYTNPHPTVISKCAMCQALTVTAEVTGCRVLNTEVIPILYGQGLDVSKCSLKPPDTSTYVVLLVCKWGQPCTAEWKSLNLQWEDVLVF